MDVLEGEDRPALEAGLFLEGAEADVGPGRQFLETFQEAVAAFGDPAGQSEDLRLIVLLDHVEEGGQQFYPVFEDLGRKIVALAV